MGAPPPSPHLTARLCGLPRSWENKTVDGCSWGRRPDLPSNNAEAPPVAETARRCWRRAPIFARAQVPPQILVKRKRSGPASRPTTRSESAGPAVQTVRLPQNPQEEGGLLNILAFSPGIWYYTKSTERDALVFSVGQRLAAWFGIRMRVLYDGASANQVRWGTKQP